MYFSYLAVLFYCHFIWFYLTCLNLINGDGDVNSGTWNGNGYAGMEGMEIKNPFPQIHLTITLIM